MSLLIFAVIATAFVIYIRSLLRRLNAKLERQRQEIRVLANRRGWQLHESASRWVYYTLRGSMERGQWEVVAKRGDGSESSSPSISWSTDDVQYRDLVGMLRTKRGFEMMQSMWGKAALGLMGAMVKVAGFSAPQHAELARDGIRLTPTSSAAAQAFVIVVRQRAGLDRLLTPALESALMAWHALPLLSGVKDSLNVDVGQTNLRVYCTGVLDADALERLIDIGIAAAAALRSGAADAA